MQAAALVALTCGPLSLVTSWVAPSPAAHSSGRSARQAANPAAQPSADPGGFAEVFLGMWLKGGAESGQEPAAQKTARSMAPDVALPEFGSRPPKVAQVRAVRSVPVRPGAWSVTAAAVLGEGKQSTVRYFRVPVLFGGGSGVGAQQHFVVTAAPAQVPGPSGQRPPEPRATVEVARGSALAATVSQFLAAYLGGSGGAERYLAPHVGLPSLGSSYSAVRTERVTSTGSADGSVAEQGQQVHVRVQVSAQDAHGAQWPMTYALRLSARDGRWEVRALESGLEDMDNASSDKDGS